MASAASIISFVVALIFAVFGIYLSKIQVGSRSSYPLDWYLTARNSLSWLNVAFAVFGASIGVWLFFPYFPWDKELSFSTQLIILGLYALAVSYPIILLAYIGGTMKTRYPTIKSVSDYARLRFGKPVAIYVSWIGLIREFALLGNLFGYFSSCQMFPVVFIALSSLCFVTFGGLPVALTVNRYQVAISVLLIIVLFSYVLSIIDLDPWNEASKEINLTMSRISPILAMAFSKPSWLFFTDGFWQRVLAAESKEALRLGSWLGALLAMCFLFIMRLIGYLGFSFGLASNSALSFVEMFMDAPQWAKTCVMLLGVLMSQGIIVICLHSLTSSLVSLSCSLGFKESLSFARIISIFVHIPLILIGILPLDTYNMFLIANTLTISSVLPLLLGLVPSLEHYVNGSSVLLGCAFSLISIFIFGYISTGCLVSGIFKYLFDEYSWQSLIVALVASLIGVALCVLVEIGLYSCAGQPYVSDIKLNGYIIHHSYESMDTADEKKSNSEHHLTTILRNHTSAAHLLESDLDPVTISIAKNALSK